MKKLLVILFAMTLTLSFTACGEKEDAANSNSANDQSVTDTNASNADSKDVSADEPDEGTNNDQNSGTGALELLTNVWFSYNDDEKFPAAGGDMSEENMTMDGPGKFDITDTTALDTTLGFPAASVDKIDDAASIMHMMNANTFTCGAFHLANSDDAADVSSAIKDNIMQRQWLCGFPDKLVIVRIDDNIISFFGENEIVDTFKTKLSSAYSSAETICDEPIA